MKPSKSTLSPVRGLPDKILQFSVIVVLLKTELIELPEIVLKYFYSELPSPPKEITLDASYTPVKEYLPKINTS